MLNQEARTRLSRSCRLSGRVGFDSQRRGEWSAMREEDAGKEEMRRAQELHGDGWAPERETGRKEEDWSRRLCYSFIGWCGGWPPEEKVAQYLFRRGPAVSVRLGLVGGGQQRGATAAAVALNQPEWSFPTSWLRGSLNVYGARRESSPRGRRQQRRPRPPFPSLFLSPWWTFRDPAKTFVVRA